MDWKLSDSAPLFGLLIVLVTLLAGALVLYGVYSAASMLL